MIKHKEVIRPIREFLSGARLGIPHQDLILRRCLNESWFSNTLAWLLDPKGTHGFGVSFADEFVRTVARIRSGNKGKYARRKSLLKWGRKGAGVSSFGFSLKNASVIREFYLTQAVSRRFGRGPRYCDVVLIDLDSSDSIFLVIENKLFSTNHPTQLQEYYKTVEDKYHRAKVREYVYLTVDGARPRKYSKEESRVYRYWIRMSWTNDILGIIEKLSHRKIHDEVRILRRLLRWFQKMENHSLGPALAKFRELLVRVTSECLLEELQRLGEGKRGEWQLKKASGKSITLSHTSTRKRPLYVELLPNFTITVHSRHKGRALFEKIIVPYGANSDQIFNLLDIAARDIYHYYFTKTHLYLADKRRLTMTKSAKKKEYKPLFDFVHRNQKKLRVLFLYSEQTWRAQQHEMREEYGLKEEI